MRKRVVALLTALCLYIPAALAQESRGTILGSVTDPQGAAVSGVTVLVTNVDTNSVKRTTANASGYYEVPLLDAGNYSVTVESTGFRKFVRSGIILNVNSRAQIDVSLELGSLAEVVQVTAEAPLLETTPPQPVGSWTTGR